MALTYHRGNFITAFPTFYASVGNRTNLNNPGDPEQYGPSADALMDLLTAICTEQVEPSDLFPIPSTVDLRTVTITDRAACRSALLGAFERADLDGIIDGTDAPGVADVLETFLKDES